MDHGVIYVILFVRLFIFLLCFFFFYDIDINETELQIGETIPSLLLSIYMLEFD